SRGRRDNGRAGATAAPALVTTRTPRANAEDRGDHQTEGERAVTHPEDSCGRGAAGRCHPSFLAKAEGKPRRQPSRSDHVIARAVPDPERYIEVDATWPGGKGWGKTARCFCREGSRTTL